MQSAAEAMSFERLLVAGFLALLTLIVALSFVMSYFQTAQVPENKSMDFALAFFKDLAFMVTGGLIGSLKSHTEKKPVT